MPERLFAGFAVQKITPPIGCAMAGYASRSGGATGVHDDLYAHAVVLRAGAGWAAIVSMDIVEVPDSLVGGIRREVSARTDISAGAILVGVTHNHSGPLVSHSAGETENTSVTSRISEAAVAAILEASDDLHPVRVRVGSVSVPSVAKNRRSLEPSPDPDVNFIGFYSGSRLDGCLINYPLHATVLGAENRQYTADYPGYLRRAIQEKHPKCCALFLNGAAGNLNIGYSADASALGNVFDFRTFEKAFEVGQKLGAAVMKGLDAAGWVDRPIVEARTLSVPLPLKDLPTVYELEHRIAHKAHRVREMIAAGVAANEVDRVRISKIYLECLRDSLLRLNVEGKREAAMPLQALRIGPAILVAIPGELFVELGLAIRQSRTDLDVFVIGYANGSWGYLPTRDAFKQGGYEAEVSVFAESMGEALVRGASELAASFAVG